MKMKLVLCAVAACTALLPSLSDAKGCLKGAAVGGIGGHVAGHHGLIGAAAGCAVGHHMANKKDAAGSTAPAPMPAAPGTAQQTSAKPGLPGSK